MKNDTTPLDVEIDEGSEWLPMWCGFVPTSRSEADAHLGCDQCEHAIKASLQAEADGGCSTCGARPGEECSETSYDLLQPPPVDADYEEWDAYLSWFEPEEGVSQ